MKFWIICVGAVVISTGASLWENNLNARREMAIARYDQKIAISHELTPSFPTATPLGPSKGHGPVACKNNRASWLASLRTSSEQHPDIWFSICCPFAFGACWIE